MKPKQSPDSADAAGPAGPADAQQMRRAFPAVIGALVCIHASMAATRVTAALLALKLGFGEAGVGVLLSLFAVAPIGLSLWAGRLADRHGLHRPLMLGVALAVTGAGLAAVWPEPPALVLAALLTGGAISVAALGIQREAGLMAREPAELKRVFSWVALGPAASNALAPVAVGVLIDSMGFRAGFVLAASLPLLAAWLGQLVPKTNAAHKAKSSAPATASGAPADAVAASGTLNEHGRLSAKGGTLRQAWQLWKLAPLRWLVLVNLSLSSCWDAHSFVVPVLGHARGLSASAIGLVLGSFAVAALLVRLLISRWATRLDEARALRLAMSVAMAICASYVFWPGVVGMMLASAVLGLALGSVQPMILAMLHQVTPAHQHGLALGVRMMATNFATIVMPLLFGWLAFAGSAALPMWLEAVLISLAMWPARKVQGHQANGSQQNQG